MTARGGTSAAGWQTAAALAGSEEARLGIIARILAAEFRAYEFSTCTTWDGPALIALRKDRGAAPGTCAVITPDMDEMRAALAEDSPPGRQGGGNAGGPDG